MKSLNEVTNETTSDGSIAGIGTLVEELDSALDYMPEGVCDAARLEAFCDSFRRLHARIRMRQAATYINGPEDLSCPGHVRDWTRLREEYHPLMGMIDRLIRSVEANLASGVFDDELLYLRMKEIVAITRRHIAEEEHLFASGVWDEIGGES